MTTYRRVFSVAWEGYAGKVEESCRVGLFNEGEPDADLTFKIIEP